MMTRSEFGEIAHMATETIRTNRALIIGIVVRWDTVLRRVKARIRGRPEGKVRVLGVDDWAWRKQQTYGTILMDLEQRRVIDLMPVRSADSFADWLRSHPDVEIITRDRCGLYANGGREGAPGARQVIDRYHLIRNLCEAVERDVQQMQLRARVELEQIRPSDGDGRKKLTWIEARRQRCRQARYQRYLAVLDLHRQGHTQLAIADKIGIGPTTIARWMSGHSFPERHIRSDRRRDQARHVQDTARGMHPSQTRKHFSAGRIASLLVKPPGMLSGAQIRYVEPFLRLCPDAHRLRKLVLQFRGILRWQKVDKLAGWIDQLVASKFLFIGQFARTLRDDPEERGQCVGAATDTGSEKV